MLGHYSERLAIVLLISMAPACSAGKDANAMRQEREQANKELASVAERVTKLEGKVQLHEFMQGLENIAYLTPGDSGYNVVAFDLGKLTVSLEDVQPYANGSRVALQFGNLTAATVNGAKAKLEWGNVDKDGSPKNDTAKSREVTFEKSLSAGSWTTVAIVLEGVPPSELGFVRVKEVSHRGISLSRR